MSIYKTEIDGAMFDLRLKEQMLYAVSVRRMAFWFDPNKEIKNKKQFVKKVLHSIDY